MRLFNSLSKAKEKLSPISAPRVGLYTCGPTVYNFQHVGNYRTYIFEDVLVRTLKFLGFKPYRVLNITDVGHLTSQGDEGEDKMEVGAAREGKTAWEIAKFYTDAFLADFDALHLLPADVLCKATDHIQEQIELISRLKNNGYVYTISDGLYFDTAKLTDYGKLMSKEHLAGLQSGARVEVNIEKKHATDFALWKFSPKGIRRQMEWDSPWGRGFPGWHIECSAMAMRYLGETFDIHCGGVDHIPIHHTNEIAQAEAATHKPFVNVWMHAEFLLMNNAKMAKSAGGFITLKDIISRGYSPLDYKYHCYSAHYRKQLDFSWDLLEAAKTARRRLSDAVCRLENAITLSSSDQDLENFKQALADDLNVPSALSILWDVLKSEKPPAQKRAFIEETEKVLALGLFTQTTDNEIPVEIDELLKQRAKARADKDFALSDVLRKQIEEKGYLVKDGKEGVKVVKK